jgi:hypothetical protein
MRDDEDDEINDGDVIVAKHASALLLADHLCVVRLIFGFLHGGDDHPR